MRTFIDIDGFNFYYGAVKGTKCKWLDFKSLFKIILRPHHIISSIKYFTATVSATAHDPDKTVRQETYLRALEAYIPEFEVFYGHFLSHNVSMPLAAPVPPDKFFETVIKTEEKGSDVNLAVHLINDAWLDLYDCAVIVSNDSDLAEAMRLVKLHHPTKTLGLITPDGARSNRTRTSSEFTHARRFCKAYTNWRP